jgi:hypothetical protein
VPSQPYLHTPALASLLAFSEFLKYDVGSSNEAPPTWAQQELSR